MATTISQAVDGTKITYTVEGKLTVQSAADFEEVLRQTPSGMCDIDVNLEAVGYISSAGLRVLVGANRQAMRRGGVLRLIKPTDDVMTVFDMTGLSEVLSIVR